MHGLLEGQARIRSVNPIVVFFSAAYFAFFWWCQTRERRVAFKKEINESRLIPDPNAFILSVPDLIEKFLEWSKDKNFKPESDEEFQRFICAHAKEIENSKNNPGLFEATLAAYGDHIRLHTGGRWKVFGLPGKRRPVVVLPNGFFRVRNVVQEAIDALQTDYDFT